MRRFACLSSAPSAFALLLLACALTDSDPAQARVHDPAAQVLRAAYGDHANEVLDRPLHVERLAGSFELSPPDGPVRVALPDDARDAIEMRVQGRDVVRVREQGLRGRAERVGGAIRYVRDGGHAYWTEGDEGGYEEWLDLDAGRAYAGRELARWDVEGATLRAHEGAVLIADEAGNAVLRVSAPRAWARSGRAVEATLGIDGTAITLEVDANGEAVLVDPLWVAISSMTTARSNFLREHGVVVLASGRALVVGGFGSTAPAASAERYDPATGTWSSAGSMSVARELHTTTVLPDGRVLVTGGNDGSAALASAEIYDPASNAWSPAAPMSRPRYGHGATGLASGRVLVTGGYAPDLTSTAELYDPATNTWSAAAAMPDPRAIHSATRLVSGRVLVTGGDALTWLTSASLYDPVTNSWSSAGAMSIARGTHSATLLADGRVLVAGGSVPSGETNGAEVYDPISNTWAPTGSMSVPRRYHTATALLGGRVLVAGGRDPAVAATTELYDPATGAWSAGPSMTIARERHAAVRLASGRVLAVGGRVATAAPTASAELLTLCGDGTVDPDEACDDGNTTAGDCCSPTCAFEPATTVCRASSCAAGVETSAASCTGTTTACPAGVMEACAPFACGADACLDACEGDEDCASGSACLAGDCREPLADGGALDGGAPDGGAPDGGVLDGGVSDGGVADGGAPDGGVADAGTAPPPDGCSCATPGSTGGSPWMAMMIAAFAFGLRRRRR